MPDHRRALDLATDINGLVTSSPATSGDFAGCLALMLIGLIASTYSLTVLRPGAGPHSLWPW